MAFDLAKLHPSDRYAVAGEQVPDDLAPLDVNAGRHVPRLVRDYLRLSAADQAAFRARLEALPQLDRTVPVAMPPAHHFYLGSQEPGAVVMRLLGNRNLGWTCIASLLHTLTGRYWTTDAYGEVGRGRKELTADLLGDLGTLLDIEPDVLADLTGIPHVPQDGHGVASLIWDLRRLSFDQLYALAETISTGDDWELHRLISEEHERDVAAKLAAARAEAVERFKEPFDIEKVLELYTPYDQYRHPAPLDQLARSYEQSYYLSCREMVSLAEFADYLRRADMG